MCESEPVIAGNGVCRRRRKRQWRIQPGAGGHASPVGGLAIFFASILQKMLDICTEYGHTWDITFSK